jgi:hypothetical protein
MSWTDEQIDELLSRYLDHELTPTEREQVEALLAARSELRVQLTAWQRQKAGLKSAASSSPRLGDDFAARVIAAAQQRVESSSDPSLAPWIRRQERRPQAATAEEWIEAASQQRRRQQLSEEPPTESPIRRGGRRSLTAWAALASVAAGILLLLAWPQLQPKPVVNALLSNHKAEQKIEGDVELSRPPTVETPQLPPLAEDQRLAIDLPLAKDERTSMSDASARNAVLPEQADPTLLSSNATGQRNSPKSLPAEAGLAATAREPVSLEGKTSPALVAPQLAPTPEQLKQLEISGSQGFGQHVMLVDLSLPPGESDFQVLRSVLETHDIPWSSQIDISAEIHQRLVESRLLSQAITAGWIPGAPPAAGGEAAVPGRDASQAVSLIFIRGRGQRLDAALVEMMRRVEDFPEFSFDLTFEPPIRSMVEELRFIQEAKLEVLPQPVEGGAASAVHLAAETEAGAWGTFFGTAARRTPPMDPRLRQGGINLTSRESSNPVVDALILVRHSR